MYKAINKSQGEAIRRRLVVIRTHVTGNNQSEFARRLRIERTRWANFELGSPITLTVVFLILKAVPGVTIEYIIEGCHDRVPAELSRRLQWLESELFPSSSSRSGHKT
jgi:hypothetical protein